MDPPSAVRSDGPAYVVESFALAGHLPPLDDALFASALTGAPLPVSGGIVGPHRNELPLGRDVVTLRQGILQPAPRRRPGVRLGLREFPVHAEQREGESRARPIVCRAASGKRRARQ